jgi:hypothetical protein
MDYKEKYNKLVESIKKLQEANPSDEGIQNWVNDNVPELRESEDERIRKYLIYCVNRTIPESDDFNEISKEQILAWLEKQGQVKKSEIREIQNGIILDGVVYELTTGFPDNELSLCGNCELNKKCIEFDGSLCYFFADNFRKVFRKVKMERKL